MNIAKSTSEVQMIAKGVTSQQAEVCDAKRETLTKQQEANAEAIAELTKTVNTLVTNVAVLKGRPGLWAAVGAAAPVALGFALWWFSR